MCTLFYRAEESYYTSYFVREKVIIPCNVYFILCGRKVLYLAMSNLLCRARERVPEYKTKLRRTEIEITILISQFLEITFYLA